LILQLEYDFTFLTSAFPMIVWMLLPERVDVVPVGSGAECVDYDISDGGKVRVVCCADRDLGAWDGFDGRGRVLGVYWDLVGNIDGMGDLEEGE
jgi:hypothetical protein